LSMMKYSSYEVNNKKIFDFIDDETFRHVIEAGEKARNINKLRIKIHDRTGTEYYVDLFVEDRNKGTEKIVRLSDRTEQRILEKSISNIQKQALLGESIADFAHDVRNPLNNISTGLQMLRKIYPDEDSLIEAVDRMQSDCIRMSDLIESVLSYSRQKMDTFKKIDLESLLNSVYARFEKKFVKYQITSSLNNICNKADIFGDYRSLERVFINILNNSIESMEESGGEIAILIKSNPDIENEIEISIADTGPGIPREILEKIYAPYVSGKKTGTGLGLAITKKILDAHQARIAIDSYTSGTIFRLFFRRYMEEL